VPNHGRAGALRLSALDEHAGAVTKGMHSSTYDRIVQAVMDCEKRRNAAFIVAARRPWQSVASATWLGLWRNSTAERPTRGVRLRPGNRVSHNALPGPRVTDGRIDGTMAQ
jgi:hypothetical protein